MSSLTSNASAPGRSRSLRIPPSSNLKPPLTAPLPPASGPTNIKLFLTNLRLLDLDLREDWPDIKAVTFSTKDAQQNQKKRIQCVEWALYQLFAIWDPEETSNKLQPFFPPLEPLQSLNLRTALFRCLDQAKKNGVLGRDTVLRKTMLDECKGERLEEVLAVFSNAVLKKVVPEDASGRYEAIAQCLALENFSYTGERTVLSVLILAHKASLKKLLTEKDDCRARYREFSELLSLNDRRITQRHEQLKKTIEQGGPHTELSEREIRSVQDRIRKNWSGNEDWLETLLYGDSRASREGLLATKFDNVWTHVEEETIGEIQGKNHVGLLQQLDARVKDQESRLARWQDFRKKLSKQIAIPSPTQQDQTSSAERRGIDLGFTAHQALQIGRDAPGTTPTTSAESIYEYNRLIENMRTELADVGKPKLRDRAAGQSLPPQNPPSSEMKSLVVEEPPNTDDEDWSSASSDTKPSLDIEPQNAKSQAPHHPTKVATYHELGPKEFLQDPVQHEKLLAKDAQKSIRNEVPMNSSSARRRLASRALDHGDFDLVSQENLLQKREPPRRHTTTRIAERSPSPIKPCLRTPPQAADPGPSIIPELDQAEQILTSMSAASPSPKKQRHTLSLAERTRLSMSRVSHSKYSDLHDETDDFPSLARLSLKPNLMQTKKSPTEEDEDKHAGLIERTRKSMAGFEAAQKKAQLDRRRSVKDAKKKQRESSYFPTVEEEVVVPLIDTKELIEGDPDYEDVFKSRPRIATSPAISPTKIWEGQEEDEY